MRAIACILLLLLALCSRAQYTIDLDHEKVEIPDCGIEVDSVIVAFNANDPIGWVLTGVKDRRKQAFIAGGAERSIGRLLQRALPSAPVERHLVIKVNALRIAEQKVHGDPVAWTALNLEFISRHGGRLVREYIYGTTLVESDHAGADYHARPMVEAIKECLLSYSSAMRTQAAGSVEVDPGTLREPTDPLALPMPALSLGGIHRGIYHHFMDFTEARPDTVRPFGVKDLLPASARHREVVLTGEAAHSTGPIWGVGYDNSLFINAGERFVQLQRDGSGFHLFAQLDPKKGSAINGDAAGLGTLVFGLAGGMLLGALMGPENTGPAESLSYDLDLLTGALRPFDAQYIDRADTRSESIFLYTDSSARDTTVCLYMYGGLEACLQRGQYHTVRLVPRTDPVPVEARAGDARRVEVKLDARGPASQVWSIRLNAEGRLTVDPLNAEDAAVARSALRPTDEVK